MNELLLAALLVLPNAEPPAVISAEPPLPRLQPAADDPLAWRLTLEAGVLGFSRNDARIPGDTGTRFSLLDVTGEDAWPVGRVTLEFDIDERHGLRLLYAPVRASGSGSLGKTVDFDGVTFAPGPAEARYVFDTYRLAYRYRFWRSPEWEWRGGVTVLARDAEIELEQGGNSATNSNFGLVPLLNLTGEWSFAERWSATFDVEAAAAPQGRAIDAALTLGYDLDERTRLSMGYRTIEGGADNDSVYTFSWLHQAVVSLRWSW